MSNKTGRAGESSGAQESGNSTEPARRECRVVGFSVVGSLRPDERLQDLVVAVSKELNDLGYSVVVGPIEPGIEPRELKTLNPPPTTIAPPPPEQQTGAGRGRTHAVTTLGLVLILSTSVVLLVFKGFDTLIAATETAEGSQGVVASMRIYLEALAPFIKVTLGGGTIGLAVKAWWTWIKKDR